MKTIVLNNTFPTNRTIQSSFWVFRAFPWPAVPFRLSQGRKVGYRDFEERVTLVDGKASAIDLVRNAVNNTISKFTKNDIMKLVPSVGKTSV